MSTVLKGCGSGEAENPALGGAALRLMSAGFLVCPLVLYSP